MKKHGLPCYPTAGFAGLFFVLGAMWYAASSQNSAAVYLLLFALGAVFLVSIPHTVLNLVGLKPTAESVKPVFAGQEASLPIEIVNKSRASRHGIAIGLKKTRESSQQIDEIPAGKAVRVTLRFPVTQRGEYEIDQLSLTSLYPLGFIRAAKAFASSQRYLVYPKPAGDPNPAPDRNHARRAASQTDFGEGDDYAGVRAYVAGESQRHIDWKAVARGQALMTKQFTTESDRSALYLDFAAVRAPDVEDKLSQLALWVIQSEQAKKPYGLRLPGIEIAPSLGEQHFHRCLRSLALFK